MVIDEGVDVVEPDRCVPVSVGDGAAEGAPTAAVGDAAELFHIHVDQLAWVVAFVSDRGRLRCSDHLAGHRVEPGEVRLTATSQDP